MSFSEDVKRFAEKTGVRLERACRAIKIELFTGVIMDTRVDTGRLRGNWQTSTGQPKYTPIERLDDSVSVGESSACTEAAHTVKAFSVDYMTNNLPYAQVWEERDGMVEKNMVRVQNNVKVAAYA